MKTYKANYLPVVLLSVFITIAVASCTGSKPDDTKDVAQEHNDAKFDNSKNENDARFLVNAAEINMEEIQLSKLAQQSGNMADVKELGKMTETAHTRLQAELDVLAKQKLVTLPATLTDNAQDAYKKLSDKSRSDFDKAYCDMMVSGHKDAIALFEKASAESLDTEIKAWAEASLATLRVHLDHALTCQKNFEIM